MPQVDSSWAIKLADEQDMCSFAHYLDRLTQLREELDREAPDDPAWWCTIENQCVTARDVVFAVLREGISDRFRLDHAIAFLRAISDALDNSGNPEDPDLTLYRAQLQRRIELLLARKRSAFQERALM